MPNPDSLLLDSAANRRVIDGMRAVGIVLVICFHVIVGLSSLLEPDDLHRFVITFPNVFNIGWQAMGSEIIFLFSGFLLSYLLLRELLRHGSIDIGNFYVRRLSRIVPLYLIALLFYWMVRGYGFTELHHLVMNLLFASKLFGFVTIIPIGWSLEVLVQSYLVLPFLVLAFMRSGHPVKMTLAAIVVGLAARYIALTLEPSSYEIRPYEFLYGVDPPRTQSDLYYQIYFRTTPFLLGFLLAYLVVYKDRVLQTVIGRASIATSLVVLSLLLIVISGFLPIQNQHSLLYRVTGDEFWRWFWTLQRFVFASGVCGLTLALWYSRVLLLKPFAWLLSRDVWTSVSHNIYSIYLFHPVFLIPAAAIAFRTYKVEEIVPIYTLEVLSIVVLVAVLSNWFGNLLTRHVEVPAQRRIRERLDGFHWRQRA